MKAYKGFKRDMTCRGFQFEEGKTYEEPVAELCRKGFHACENPLDCLLYYAPADSVYHEVELDEVSDKRSSDDSKVAARKITIGARLDAAGLVKAHFAYIASKCKNVPGVVAGDWQAVAVKEKQTAAAGEYGSAAAGPWGSAAAGEYGSAAAGFKGSAAAGSWGSAAAGEHGSAVAGEQGSVAAGEYGSAAAGPWGSAAAGEYGSAAAGFKGSAAAGSWGSAAAGEQGIAACRGGKAKGGLGCVLAISEIDVKGNNIAAKAVIVDGEIIKADTWYTLKNGELVEV